MGQKQGIDSPSEILEGINSANTLILEFWPSELWENKFLPFKATHFIVIFTVALRNEHRKETRIFWIHAMGANLCQMLDHLLNTNSDFSHCFTDKRTKAQRGQWRQPVSKWRSGVSSLLFLRLNLSLKTPRHRFIYLTNNVMLIWGCSKKRGSKRAGVWKDVFHEEMKLSWAFKFQQDLDRWRNSEKFLRGARLGF